MLKEFNYHSRVMGCSFDMTFVAENVAQADHFFTQAQEIAQRYEGRFSRFIETSELSQLNLQKKMDVTDEFFHVFLIAKELHLATDGIFNPLLQVAQIGYDTDFSQVRKNPQRSSLENVYNVDMNLVQSVDHNISLGLMQNLDFGGFLKGYVAEIITHEVSSPYGCVVSVGGDLFVKGCDYNDQEFEIEIENPFDEESNLVRKIRDCALCTSGIHERVWKVDRREKHHILDTETQDSAKTDIVSASVIHESGAVADAFATLAVAMGAIKAKEFLDKKEMTYALICANNEVVISSNF